jgi:hypothetical protein
MVVKLFFFWRLALVVVRSSSRLRSSSRADRHLHEVEILTHYFFVVIEERTRTRKAGRRRVRAGSHCLLGTPWLNPKAHVRLGALPCSMFWTVLFLFLFCSAISDEKLAADCDWHCSIPQTIVEMDTRPHNSYHV